MPRNRSEKRVSPDRADRPFKELPESAHLYFIEEAVWQLREYGDRNRVEMDTTHEIAIAELGINLFGDIMSVDELAEIRRFYGELTQQLNAGGIK